MIMKAISLPNGSKTINGTDIITVCTAIAELDAEFKKENVVTEILQKPRTIAKKKRKEKELNILKEQK